MTTRLRVLLVACVLSAGSQPVWGQAALDGIASWGGGPAAADRVPSPIPAQPNPGGQMVSPPSQVCTAIECRDACYQGTWQVFGDFLYIRPGQDRVAYAVPINGAIIPPVGVAPVQVGPIATADVEFNPGVRVGVSHTLDDCSRIGVTYSHLDADSHDTVSVDPSKAVLQSLVSHPGTSSAPSNFLSAVADADVRFNLADVDFRHTWLCDERMSLNYVVGVRYAHLEQGFDSLFTFPTTETVDTRLTFDGGGIRFGLEGQRRAICSGMTIYGSAMASFVGGRFAGTYNQLDTPSGTFVSTGWNDDRIVPILELELGVAWVGCCGHLRISGGYMFSSWFNVPRTEDFIHAVQTNDLSVIHDALTFDGLAVRTELRF